MITQPPDRRLTQDDIYRLTGAGLPCAAILLPGLSLQLPPTKPQIRIRIRKP